MSAANPGIAVKEMVQPFFDYWNGDALMLPGKEFATPDAATRWAALTIEHVDGSQATLANAGGKRRWQHAGVVTIELRFPRSDLDVGAAYAIAGEVAALYQGKRTASDVWFRNARIQEGITATWFALNVIFEFEYDTIN
jgi:hypothetical protein